MNLKLFVGIGLLVTTNIMAQDDFYGDTGSSTGASSYESTDSYSSSPPVPAPIYQSAQDESSLASSSSEASVGGDESLNDFNKLHGNAYNTVGNEGASATVASNLRAPHTMNGQNLVYFEPTLEYGLVSFTKGSTYYLALDNSGKVGLMTLGMAMSGMGFSLDLGLGKTFASSETGGVESSGSSIALGDDIGLRFSMPLGGLSFSAHLEWLTIADQVSTETPATEVNANYWDFLLEAEVSNASSAKDFFWTGGASILRRNLTEESITTGPPAATVNATDPNSHIEVAPYFNVAMKVLGNDRARVLVGSNNTLGFQVFDKITNVTDGAIEFGLFLAPNIFAEIALTKNWMFFGGASHNLNLFTFSSEEFPGNSSSSVLQMLTEQTVVEIGTRFQWKSIALEASLADTFLENPFSTFNGGALAANLGAFIYF
jgi:hypothetical protein